MIGTALTHYRITAKLGEGGMGEVYRASDTKLGREVAIKVLPTSFSRNPQSLARFEREAKALASLNHPHIASIYGFDAERETHFLVMELVEGQTLSERLRRGRLPLDEALRVARQIAEAVEAAHAKGIIHRDLKPGNIKLTPEGRVEVLDFSLAKAVTTESTPASPDSPTITADYTLPGTLLGIGRLHEPGAGPGWAFTETGGGRDNEQYGVDTGASTTGDTYSYGAAGSTERAFGQLRSGTLIPSFGAQFQNNSGAAIIGLSVHYTGEEWRLGAAARTDQMNFEYSTEAISLTAGTWTGVSGLNFVTPDTVTVGAKNGNAAPDRTVVGPVSVSGLQIANGASFWVRWTDTDASGADDGLAVDDFGLSFTNVPEPSTYALFAGLGLMGFGVRRRARR